MLTRELRREAYLVPAIVFGAGMAFGCLGLLAHAVRQGQVGPWGVHVLYGALGVAAATIGWACLRGSGKTTVCDGYQPPLPERPAIVSQVRPDKTSCSPRS